MSENGIAQVIQTKLTKSEKGMTMMRPFAREKAKRGNFVESM